MVPRYLSLTLLFLVTLCAFAQSGSTYPTVTRKAAALTNAPIQQISTNQFRIGLVLLDKSSRSLTFPAAINMSSNLIEFVCDSGDTKLHESLLRTDVSPLHVHLAALLLSKSSPGDTNPIPVSISVLTGKDQPARPLEDFIQKSDPKSGKASPMAKGNWVYTGWNQYGGRLPSEISGVVIALLGDSTALINSKDPDHEDDQLWRINPENTPSVGTKVEIKVTFPKSKS